MAGIFKFCAKNMAHFSFEIGENHIFKKWDNSQNLTKNEDLSVDIVDVAPTNREFVEVGQFMKNPSALYQQDDGIVLNASFITSEPMKGVKEYVFLLS